MNNDELTKEYENIFYFLTLEEGSKDLKINDVKRKQNYLYEVTKLQFCNF